MSENNQTLCLVDGTAYVYRAYHAFSNLSTLTGEPTGAIYGTARMLKQIIRDQQPAYLVVVFDAKGKTFRDEIYSEYKANRSPMPDDLRSQYAVIQEMVPAMGIATFSIPGVEADDVIGTLAVRATQDNLNTVIASFDKDLYQLVDETTVIRDDRKSIDINRQGVRDKFGVDPEQIVDFLALVGDSSDNIPGISLVGPKTAAKWLNKFSSLDAVIKNSDLITGKAGQNLRDNLDQLALAKQLVTLKLDVDVEFNLQEFKLSPPEKSKLREIYTKMEFRTWLRELDDDEVEADKPANYVAVVDERELDKLTASLSKTKQFALDTETTGFDMTENELVGISVCDQVGEAFYIPVGHNDEVAHKQLDRDLVLSAFKPILENPSISKIIQNCKFDVAVFQKYEIELKGMIYDTMLESYVFNSTAVSRHNMDTLALKYLNQTTTKFEDVAGKGKNQLTFNQVKIDIATNYAAEDADIAFRLHQQFWPELEKNQKLARVFTEIEMPLVPVISRIESNGVLLDVETLANQSAEFKERMEVVEQSIYKSAGLPFNLSSPKQIQEVLFGRLGLPILKKTSSGQPSTSEDVLSDLARKYEIPKLILEYRSLFKLKSTYTDKLPELVHPVTGRVHTSYHQAVAATGRLSSADPNLQNIPIRTSDGKRVREAFVADSGNVLLSIDYSQIELRLMAHLSSDSGLVNAFLRGDDVHQATAAEVFNVDLSEVTFDQRRHAKAINFGLMYGMSAYGLARQLQIENNEAGAYIERYFGRYPGVEAFMDSSKEHARKYNFVETMFGRRLYVPDINARHYGRRQHAERTAINAPLQGSAADIIKIAMINVDRWIRYSGSSTKIIMQVHDELVLEVPESELEATVTEVSRIMESATELRIPLIVESGFAKNWAEAHG